VRATTGVDGGATAFCDYTPFGEAYDLGYSCPEDVAFAGQGRDAATGWYRLRARQYDPKVGRFVSPDPSGYAGGENLYAYANNNPVRWVDLSGRDPTDPATGRPAEEEGGAGLPLRDRLPGGTGRGPNGYNSETGQGLYVLRDKEGTVRYVGIGDAPGRVEDHRGTRSPFRHFEGEIISRNSLTKAEARGLEHLLIKYYGGPRPRLGPGRFGPPIHLWNKNGGISAKNYTRLELEGFIRAAEPLFDEVLGLIGGP
jgi:RHS repeat-associated protein